MSEKKQRETVWMPPGLQQRIEGLYSTDDCNNRSQFICKAVEFYCGYLESERAAAYLSGTLLPEFRGGMQRLEKTMSQAVFRLAVELSMTMNVVAAANQVDPVTLWNLRKKCGEDVRKSVGSVRFDSIYGYQHRLDEEEAL